MDHMRRVLAFKLSCPPFGPDKLSFANIDTSAHLNTQLCVGSSPVFYSSFRRSPASDAQLVVRHFAGPHEISIERDARAAFTLWRYPSLRFKNYGFEGRKRPFSLVTDASHFTGMFAASKGLDVWRWVKSVVCSGRLILLAHCIRMFSTRLLLFLLPVFSSLSDSAGTLIRRIRIDAGTERSAGDNHFPEDSSQSPCHGSSGFPLDAGTLDESLVAFPKAAVVSSHLESSFTECPAEGGRTGLGDLAGVLLPIGQMRSLCEAAPAGDGIGVFEPIKITELRKDDKSKDFADTFGTGDDGERFLKVFVCLENQSNIAQDGISLSFDDLNAFEMLPEHRGLNGIEFFAVGSDPSMQAGGVEGIGASGVGLVEFPSDDGFNLGSLLSDSMPLPSEYTQMSDFGWWNICRRNQFAFHDSGNLGSDDFIGVGQTRTQFAQVEGVEQMNLVGHGLEHIPEPVIRAHGFNANAEWFFEGLDKSYDFAGAMVWNGHFLEAA